MNYTAGGILKFPLLGTLYVATLKNKFSLLSLCISIILCLLRCAPIRSCTVCVL